MNDFESSPPPTIVDPFHDRRQFVRTSLLALAGATAGSLLVTPGHALNLANPGRTPSQIEGPFFFDTGLVRPDIAEGKPGIPMRLDLRVLSAATGQPVANADVAIWHSTAGGVYSGYAPNMFQSQQTSGRNYCRGYQVTDASGRVGFNTIYPGWYVVRTPHVHVKVRVAGREVLTTQLYFDEAVNNEVFDVAKPYSGRGVRPVNNSNDGGFDTRLLLALTVHPGSIRGSFDLCIA